MMNAGRFVTLAALAMACSLPPATFADALAVREETPGLLKLAKVTPEAAAATARAQVPDGTIVAAEIEKEGGKLIYSFEIKIAGRAGEQEVNVDAVNGSVVGVEHETPQSEAAEGASEKP